MECGVFGEGVDVLEPRLLSDFCRKHLNKDIADYIS